MPTLAPRSTSQPAIQSNRRIALWAQWAVALSFLAVFCLLLAPASLLAQDLSWGKLGGVCTVAKAPSTQGTGDVDGNDSAHGHCPLCSVSWGLPPAGTPLALAASPAPDRTAHASADPAARVRGLPFSRAPPAQG